MNEQSALSPAIQAEIGRVAQAHNYDVAILSELVAFAIAQAAPSKPAKTTKAKKPKAPTIPELKQQVFARFGVANLAALKKSPLFQHVSPEQKPSFSGRAIWEFLLTCELPDLPPPPKKPLSLPALKQAVYDEFSVTTTKALKASPAFQMATDGMDSLNLGKREGWETIYRKFIGILPEEENQTGPDCINGVNIFKYFRPWQVFGLDPKTAEDKDVKAAYHQLSRMYHPDNAETGDSRIFQRINQMYRSLVAEA